MTSGQHAERRRQSVGPTEARDLGPGAAWWRSKPTGGIDAPGRARATARSWAGRVWRSSGLPASGCSRLMRENQRLLGAGSIALAAAVAAIPMTVRSSLMPRTSTDGVRVVTVDDGWGWIFTAASIGAPSVDRLACLQARRPLRRPSSRNLHGAFAIDGSTAAGALGGCLADHGPRLSPFTNQIKFWGIQAVLRLRHRRAPDHGVGFSVESSPLKGAMVASSATSLDELRECRPRLRRPLPSTMPNHRGSSKRTAT